MMSMDFETSFHAIEKGDTSAFPAFYESTKKDVFYNILSLCRDYALSEDLLQETFIRFLENRNRVSSPSKAKGYLMRISRNLTLDALSKRSKESQIEDDSHVAAPKDPIRIDEEFLLGRLGKVLNDFEFRILVLHVLDEMTFEEIRRLLHKPLGTVLWTYNQAIKKCRKELQDETPTHR